MKFSKYLLAAAMASTLCLAEVGYEAEIIAESPKAEQLILDEYNNISVENPRVQARFKESLNNAIEQLKQDDEVSTRSAIGGLEASDEIKDRLRELENDPQALMNALQEAVRLIELQEAEYQYK